MFVNPRPDWPGSLPEWRVYCGIWKARQIDGDPRNPPSAPGYRGYPGVFAYQDPFEGGRIGGPGGQVFDFTIFNTDQGEAVVIRVQGYYWHTQNDAELQARDALLLARASAFYRVVDVYDYEVMADDTGEAAVIAVKNALSGVIGSNPITAGLNRR